MTTKLDRISFELASYKTTDLEAELRRRRRAENSKRQKPCKTWQVYADGKFLGFEMSQTRAGAINAAIARHGIPADSEVEALDRVGS